MQDQVPSQLNFFLPQFQAYKGCIQLEIVETAIKNTINQAFDFREEELLFEGYCLEVARRWREWHNIIGSRHSFIKKFLIEVDLIQETYNPDQDSIFDASILQDILLYLEELHRVIDGIIFVSVQDYENLSFSQDGLNRLLEHKAKRKGYIRHYFDSTLPKYLRKLCRSAD